MKLLPIEGGNISDSIPGAKKGSRVKLLQIEGGNISNSIPGAGRVKFQGEIAGGCQNGRF